MNTAKHENPRAYLIPYPVESFAQPIAVAGEATIIGRSADDGVQVQLGDSSVSRRHACIHSAGGQFAVEDLDSQNGTFVNRERIRRTPLSSHDKITIGNQTFLFLVQPDPACELVTEPALQTSETIALRLQEIDLSALWAQNAEQAARGFLAAATSNDPDALPRSTLAHQRLSLLYRLSEKLRGVSEIGDVYDRGIELVMEAIPAAELTLVAARSPNRNAFNVLSHRMREAQLPEDGRIPISRTVFNWVLAEKVLLVSQDLSADERFLDSESIRIHDLRSILCVPIAGKQGVGGLLYAQANNLLSPFNKDDAIFASAVANEMALNIDNIRLQEGLRSSERMAAIGLTVSNLAHNIKNLLAINQSSAQLMDIHIKEKDFPHIEKRWRAIQHSLKSVRRLANDMLEFAKEEALSLSPVDINDLIRRNRPLFEEGLSPAGVTFEYRLSRRNPRWTIDAAQFQRALFNLILNAADAVKGKPGGRIRIVTAVGRDRALRVSVADNGCGIPRHKAGQVLDLFFTTKGTNGTGLGLPMVQRFVAKSGGHLRFYSREGAGSVFKMIFPAPPP